MRALGQGIVIAAGICVVGCVTARPGQSDSDAPAPASVAAPTGGDIAPRVGTVHPDASSPAAAERSDIGPPSLPAQGPASHVAATSPSQASTRAWSPAVQTPALLVGPIAEVPQPDPPPAPAMEPDVEARARALEKGSAHPYIEGVTALKRYRAQTECETGDARVIENTISALESASRSMRGRGAEALFRQRHTSLAFQYAQISLDRGCLDTADAIYRRLIRFYLDPQYDGIRDLAMIGVDDVREQRRNTKKKRKRPRRPPGPR